MAAIDLEGVTKVYPDGTEAVSAFDLAIADGEFVVLVGPSGCGKTSVLRMVAGLEEISAGVVRIGGRTVNHLLPKDRDIAMVFQNYALYPHMTVFANMAFGLRQRKTPKAEIARRVNAAARTLGLADALDKKPRTLSGGQRQRVAMGRAIVREPQAFLMDEPLSNLDAKLRVEMRAEIARIQRDLSVTTVYVTHDQTEAMTMGDRVAVMRRGLLQQVDAPQALYDRPANLFVAEFIGSPAMNLVDAELKQVDGALVACFGEHELRVGETVVTARPSLTRFAGRRVLLGIRPEDVEDAERAADVGPGRTLAAVTDIREDMGNEVYVHLSVGVPRVRRPEVEEAIAEDGAEPGATPTTGAAFVGRLDRETRAREGEPITLVVDTNRLYFFDPVDGQAIEPSREPPATP
jgi:multiple sugar transport system ATP-binding protein